MLLPYVSEGIADICVGNKIGKWNFAFRGGRYLGAPGKELFFALNNLSEKESFDIAKILSKFFPKKSPDNHVKWAAFLRYTYGCFEKQGCLRSKADQERMVNEKPDWTLPDLFVDKLVSIFNENKNYYGLTMCYEMKGHRAGDSAIINNDCALLETMMDFYNKSTKYAKEINCVKHIFTNMYWSACYYEKFNLKEKSLYLHKKNIELMAAYCPDSREGYQSKAAHSLKYISENSDSFSWILNVVKNIQNDNVRKWSLWRKYCKKSTKL